MPLPALTGLTPDALAVWLEAAGEPAFRAVQILEWVWEKKVSAISAMTNLPVALRENLASSFCLTSVQHTLTTGSPDSTRKLLFRLHDRRYIESVLIPANPALYGEKSDRRTLCVSSQVGCAFGCKFCASGLSGFIRHLDASEIAGQVLAAEQLTGERVDNLVFMGMGEPLANLNHLLNAIALITGEKTLNLGARHLTISTSGLVPQIRQLANHPQQIRLAISLHGATDAVRQQIMPLHQKWPIAELVDALEFWNSKKTQKITLEYILIQGINDALEHATILARLARRLHAKVNLIPYNLVLGLSWQRPSDSHCRAFRDVLQHAGVTATLRLEKGGDINAACGQLRLQQESHDAHLGASSPDTRAKPHHI
jgi:23S rRNA (adenine2503-C2)-methyltransferase